MLILNPHAYKWVAQASERERKSLKIDFFSTNTRAHTHHAENDADEI